MQFLQPLFLSMGKEDLVLLKTSTSSNFNLRKLCIFDFESEGPKRSKRALLVCHLVWITTKGAVYAACWWHSKCVHNSSINIKYGLCRFFWPPFTVSQKGVAHIFRESTTVSVAEEPFPVQKISLQCWALSCSAVPPLKSGGMFAPPFKMHHAAWWRLSWCKSADRCYPAWTIASLWHPLY